MIKDMRVAVIEAEDGDEFESAMYAEIIERATNGFSLVDIKYQFAFNPHWEEGTRRVSFWYSAVMIFEDPEQVDEESYDDDDDDPEAAEWEKNLKARITALESLIPA